MKFLPSNSLKVILVYVLSVLALLSCSSSMKPDWGEGGVKPFTYSSPILSSQGVLAYCDRGYRENGTYIDSLAGIWLVNLPAGSRSHISTFGDYPSWSPDGSRLSFWSNYSIWIYDLGTEQSRVILVDGLEFVNPPSWSPCDGTLVYASTKNSPYDFTLWGIGPDSGVESQISPSEGGLKFPVWFGSCDSLVCRKYYEDEGTTKTKIVLRSTSSDFERNLVGTDRDERSLAVSTSGRFLSFHVIQEDGTPHFFVYDLGDNKYTDFSNISGQDVSWVPGFEKFLYVGKSKNNQSDINSQVFQVDMNTGEIEVLF